MKLSGGMYYPDGEVHMIDWNEKNGVTVDGKVIYQHKKQIATFAQCKQFRVAVDIGAHIGHWSIGMAKRFEYVYAFEPVEEHRNCFKENVQGVNVLLHAVALGAEAGQVSITRDAHNSGASHVDTAIRPASDYVPMITLDSLGLVDVDLIKMDVEGYETNVIAGAKETLLRCRPIVCCEQKRDFACKYGLKRTAATDALQALGMRQIMELGGDFIMGW